MAGRKKKAVLKTWIFQYTPQGNMVESGYHFWGFVEHTN